MKLLIISDSSLAQVNGVARTLQQTVRELTCMGHIVTVICPETLRFWTVAAPFYPEISLEFFASRRIAVALYAFAPDHIHIATEGPLGWAARHLCVSRRLAFTTAYHTRFPEYLATHVPRLLAGLVAKIAYAVLRRFHRPSAAVMVATASLQADLAKRGFRRLQLWPKGVDGASFHPAYADQATYGDLPRPILLYVGRVAPEKNLDALLCLDTAGSKIIVGDGPDLAQLRKRHPDAHFLGSLDGTALARAYASADLFVFPSLTETLGLVLLEAAASGLRIAACPAPGPLDLFSDPACAGFAALDTDLSAAIRRALRLPVNPALPRAWAAPFSWYECTRRFLALAVTDGGDYKNGATEQGKS